MNKGKAQGSGKASLSLVVLPSLVKLVTLVIVCVHHCCAMLSEGNRIGAPDQENSRQSYVISYFPPYPLKVAIRSALLVAPPANVPLSDPTLQVTVTGMKMSSSNHSL